MRRLYIVTVCATFCALGLSSRLSAQTTLPAGPMQNIMDLPVQKEMPDPLIGSDGRKVTTPEQWPQRRAEMKKLLEDYVYGHMPPPPGNVKGREIRSALVMNGSVQYRMVHLTFGPDEKLGFDIGIFTPADSATAKAPFPAFIGMGFSAGENSINGYRDAIGRGYAVVTIGYQQLGADNPNYRSTAFFPAYPEYDWNDFAAWAWGISRCMDYLQTDPAIDKSKIAATGVSRLGQAVLLAGAFDERIALVAPVGAGTAFRFSGKDRGGKQGIDEVVDQNTYWFGPRFAEFKGQTDRMPSDQHWLPALVAPRLFIYSNALSDQYGSANAILQAYLSAKPVFQFLGVPDHLGLHFRPGQHGIQPADWQAILDFADLHLRDKPINRRFDEIPPADQMH